MTQATEKLAIMKTDITNNKRTIETKANDVKLFAVHRSIDELKD